jgi:F0F1-type ATP synthase membrane subunit b/b'
VDEQRSITHEQEHGMQIDKSQIIEMLRSQGQEDKASQAESELPGQVDTDQHADLLEKLGVSPQDLIGKLGGGLGGLGLG